MRSLLAVLAGLLAKHGGEIGAVWSDSSVRVAFDAGEKERK